MARGERSPDAPVMRFSDEEIILAAISATKLSETKCVDLKDIYLEMLDCTSYSKVYRFRYEIVSRQRLINVILTNGFKVVGSRPRCKLYEYDPELVKTPN